MYIIADTFQIILRMFLSFQTFLSSSSYKVIECCQFLLPELDVGKEKAKQRKRKEEARRRRKKVLLRNRGAGLRLPKDSTLSLPFYPGLLSSCPSVLSCKRVSCCGQWAPHQGRSGGPLMGGLLWLRGDGPDPRLPVCTWIPLGPIVQWLRSVLTVPWSLRDGCQCLLWVNTPTVNLMYLINFCDIQPAAWGVDLWDHHDTCACSSLGSVVTVVSTGPWVTCKATGALRGALSQNVARENPGGRKCCVSEEPSCCTPRVKWPHARGCLCGLRRKKQLWVLWGVLWKSCALGELGDFSGKSKFIDQGP